MSAGGESPIPPSAPADRPSTPAAPAKDKSSDAHPLEPGSRALLSLRQMRKLRQHQDEFARALAARLSLFLRVELTIKIVDIQIMSYQRLTAAWSGVCHLSLFKTEPLRGVSILELPIPLGMSLVDRMMGGSGKSASAPGQEISEIEAALLDQLVQIVVEEWCANWASVKELKPALLGSETNGAFLQTAPPQANMLSLTLQVSAGELQEDIQLAFPYAFLEPVIRQLCGESETPSPVPSAASNQAAGRWLPCFDDVSVGLSAEWEGFEMTAGDILNLKPGDVLQLDSERAGHVLVRMAAQPKFHGRLGAVGSQWAVELTKSIKR